MEERQAKPQGADQQQKPTLDWVIRTATLRKCYFSCSEGEGKEGREQCFRKNRQVQG